MNASHAAPMLVHVPTALGDSQLAESYRSAGQPPQYTHPQQVSRYAIGGVDTATMPTSRFRGVGHE